MPFLEKATALFESRRQLRSIRVEELDETIYYYPVMTVEEVREITAHRQGGEVTADALIATLIVRARDADGNRMFHKADRVTLAKKVDIELIASIVNRMVDEGLDMESATGN